MSNQNQNQNQNQIPDSANPKDAQARKKVPIELVPPALVIGAAEALADGARKYGAYNWRDIAIRFSVYIAAIERHTLALKDGEDEAPDSHIHHLKHIAAGVSIALDALGHGNLIDDRKKGPGAKLLAEAHQKQLGGLTSKTITSFEELVKRQSQQQLQPVPITQGQSFTGEATLDGSHGALGAKPFRHIP